MNDWQTCVGNCQPVKTRFIHVICMTLHKMADGREDNREATFQFIEEVQNCPDLWDVLSAAYKDTKIQANCKFSVCCDLTRV